MTATTTSIADATQMLKDLYNDTETRPQKVAEALHTAGLATVLQKAGLNVSADKVVDALASMTTIEGFVEKKNAAKDIAGEYIAKARDTDGRKEIVEEIAATETYQTAKATITEKVVEPVSAKINAGKELAAPYVASAKEMSDPYVAKLAELRKSERVEAMISAFNEVGTHATPTARFLFLGGGRARQPRATGASENGCWQSFCHASSCRTLPFLPSLPCTRL